MSDMMLDDNRRAARYRLRAKVDFRNYLFVWFFIAAVLSIIWFLVTPNVYFWPVWAIAGMGVGALVAGWDAYGSRQNITEANVDAEVYRMNRMNRTA
jgi:hypothetical protein